VTESDVFGRVVRAATNGWRFHPQFALRPSPDGFVIPGDALHPLEILVVDDPPPVASSLSALRSLLGVSDEWVAGFTNGFFSLSDAGPEAAVLFGRRCRQAANRQAS
jgi:hypothetical protein